MSELRHPFNRHARGFQTPVTSPSSVYQIEAEKKKLPKLTPKLELRPPGMRGNDALKKAIEMRARRIAAMQERLATQKQVAKNAFRRAGRKR